MGAIYLIRNKVSGKGYVGQCVNDVIKRRVNYHLNGKGSKLVAKAVKKYGNDVFSFEIIHDGVINELLGFFEIEAIAKFNTFVPNGYNLTLGGDTTTGYTHTVETKRKIGHASRSRTPETLRKIGEAARNRSAESNLKISLSKIGSKNPNYGNFTSSEVRKTLSQAHYRRLAKHRTNPNQLTIVPLPSCGFPKRP